MFIEAYSLKAIAIALPLSLLVIQPASAQTSDSDRIQKLERAVEQLQKQNTELQKEISSLKKQSTTSAAPVAPGKTKTVVSYDGKTYVEKSVAVEEKPGIFVTPRGPEFKLVLGGFIQMNLEDGDVSAFEGRFGQTALKDRFRLRRARINLTGEFAEKFDFKVEGDFETERWPQLESHRIFEATDIFVNWHQFPGGADQDRPMESAIRLGAAHSGHYPVSLSSAVCRPGRSRRSGRSVFSFGGNHSPTFGLSRRIC